MAIPTTISMRGDVLEKIDRASERMGVSRTCVMRMLLASMLDDPGDAGNYPNAVLYQEREDAPGKRGVYMSIHEEDYDRYLDLRHNLRMSLSLIVARAATERLDALIEDAAAGKLLLTDGGGDDTFARKRIARGTSVPVPPTVQ